MSRAGVVAAVLLALATGASAQNVTKTWAVAEFAEPLYDENMPHWPYANPDAPAGGQARLAEVDNFDTLNFYVLKGRWPQTIGLIYDSLMTKSGINGTYLDYGDEITARYGLLAESVEYPEDLSWAIFNLRPQARYHDGEPVLARDFVFALETIKEHARPFVKAGYAEVEKAEALGPRRVKYTFTTKHSLKPLITAADSSPLPLHYWRDRDITAATLEPPLGSGPYKVAHVEGGRQIVYERVDDYWARDLNVAKGLHHFGEIRVDYYKDATVAFEAFKAGQVDFRDEFSVKRWEQEYDFPAAQRGEVRREAREQALPSGMMGYFFNLRREAFQDVRVREAIALLYDFETVQKRLLFGHFRRIKNYFSNTEYAATALPDARELALLEPFREQLPPALFTEVFAPPVSDGSGRDRRAKRRALRLLKAAGWEQRGGKMVNAASGEPLRVELMTGRQERVRLAGPFIDALQGMGIEASIRYVDAANWQSRIQQHDFDMWVGGYYFYPPPDQRLYSYFHSSTADTPGANSSGIEDPVVDVLIETIVASRDKPTLLAASRALDRVMLWRHYAVPTYFRDKTLIAYSSRFGQPQRAPKYAVGWLSTWWVEAAESPD